jgi:uncharacterized protein (DUF2062 family)/trans-aconitate methyltransferase
MKKIGQGKYSREIRDLLYKMRTEGMSPGKQAGAVALGVFIGCTPFYGFHLPLCLICAKLLRLNPALTYLAAHISVPGSTPFLLMAELEIGRRLRGQSYLHIHHISNLWALGIRQMGVDMMLGCLIIGGGLAILLSAITWWVARRRHAHPRQEALLEKAALPYLESGMLDWEFVRGKLRHDPLYFNLLRLGFLESDRRLLDLGCGRGILFSLLLAARAQAESGNYPEGWAPPPSDLALHGIEGRPQVAAAAALALAGRAVIVNEDLRTAELPPADAILLLDVLHYLPAADQDALLAKAVGVLQPGGVLLIRDADAGAGWRFALTRLQERFSALLRRHRKQRFSYRSAAEWTRALQTLGLAVDVQPMGMGTPYANVLLAGRK